MTPGRRGPNVLSVRRFVALALLVASAAVAPGASALVWPDVPERVERGLASPDPARRRVAAHELANLGGARATPLVLKALADADVEVRLAASQSAIRLRVAPATDAAIVWLGERDAKLRVAACEVARAMPNPRAVQPLARALGDTDPQVRSSCANALGASGSPEAVAPLSGKLDDPTPNVRADVARALARLGDGRAVVPLVGKVQDSVPDVRQAVVRALGDLGDTRATQALLLALRDTAPEVKVEALAALGRLRAPDAVDAIAPLALDRNAGVRQAALVALGRIGTDGAVRALVKALGTQEDATAGVERTPVRDALVAAGAPAVAELTALLDRPVSPAVASSAAWVLGELRATKSAPAIVAALRKGTLPQTAALRALAGAGTPEQVPVVLEFVSDPSPATRAEARLAATALLDPSRPDGRAVEPLAATLKSPRTTPGERAAVATLLGRTGAPRAATELIGLVGSKDEGLRLAAIDALGALGAADAGSTMGSAVDDVLVPLLADVDPAVRLRAAVAIGASGGTTARRSLLSKLDGGEELDRFALFEALGGVLARHPDDAAARRVFAELGVAAGPERDAVISAAGRARAPSVPGSLAATAKSHDVDDRRAVATVLAAQSASPQALALARALTSDGDASVRAEATFALGSLGDASLLPVLVGLARSGDADVATNAAGAIARSPAGRRRRRHARPAAALARPAPPRRRPPPPHRRAGRARSPTPSVRCSPTGAPRCARTPSPRSRPRDAAARTGAASGSSSPKTRAISCAGAPPAPSWQRRSRKTGRSSTAAPPPIAARRSRASAVRARRSSRPRSSARTRSSSSSSERAPRGPRSRARRSSSSTKTGSSAPAWPIGAAPPSIRRRPPATSSFDGPRRPERRRASVGAREAIDPEAEALELGGAELLVPLVERHLAAAIVRPLHLVPDEARLAIARHDARRVLAARAEAAWPAAGVRRDADGPARERRRQIEQGVRRVVALHAALVEERLDLGLGVRLEARGRSLLLDLLLARRRIAGRRLHDRRGAARGEREREGECERGRRRHDGAQLSTDRAGRPGERARTATPASDQRHSVLYRFTLVAGS
ncbi:MAG: HEAT repeat domain-containing protein [Labilithrix sp.]|nr:HEAT repeat domain-containing protein [Labilithrix sp.]